MRVNWHERVETDELILTAYRRALVPLYHRWMADPWLREATASEEMSLDEEYSAQRGWRDDGGKLTFIFFDAKTKQMVGDVNLFELDAKAAEGDYSWGSGAGVGVPTFEVMVMVGDAGSRRRGLAGAAVRAVVRYAVERLGARRLVAKIATGNTPSRSLFGRLGFREDKVVAAFDEVHCITEADGVALKLEGKWEIVKDDPGAGEEEEET